MWGHFGAGKGEEWQVQGHQQRGAAVIFDISLLLGIHDRGGQKHCLEKLVPKGIWACLACAKPWLELAGSSFPGPSSSPSPVQPTCT